LPSDDPSPLERILGLVLASALVASCASATPVRAAAPDSPKLDPGHGEFPDEGRALLRFHSSRFGLSVPLPDGRAWRIDDHKNLALLAVHPPTRSTLTLQSFTDPEAMSRQKCEERARTMGLVALRDPHTVEDVTLAGPGAYDSRVWVALETGTSTQAPLSGHVFLFGAFLRKCLFVHYATQVASEREEAVLTSRLAVARLRILPGIGVEAFDRPLQGGVSGP
jgi:hypothetical protein